MNPLRLTLLRRVVFVLAAVPFARLFVLGYLGDLTANPVEFVTRSLGTWCLVMLCLTLAITPLRRLTGAAWWLRLRRMLGLWAFFYGSVHLLTYVWFDQWFDVAAIWDDVVKRPFIAAGFVSWLLMVPLAFTSNQWAMRRLGRRWSVLHRLIYLLAPVGVLHFWWHKSAKNDLFEPMIYAAVIGLLLAMRLLWRWRRSMNGPLRSKDQEAA
ncbi:MAG: protein-methionine-sulfoxide reductase heme-binding subunit MsrQ [Burkholderiaceae bacterium]